MKQARIAAILLATALMVLPGCVRVIPPTAQPPADMARVEKLALQIALNVDGRSTYAATTWNEARLTVGRHDGTMSPITYTFAAIRVGSSSAGLRGVGQFPVLPPGDGYWLQVELVQTHADGTQRIVGRGIQGDEDDVGVQLLAGGNLAHVAIAPTVQGALLALTPVRPPEPPRDPSWDTRWEPTMTTGVTEVPVTAEQGTFREFGGWDTTPRKALELEAPEYYTQPDDSDDEDDSSDDDDDDDDDAPTYDYEPAPVEMEGDAIDTGMALQGRRLE